MAIPVEIDVTQGPCRGRTVVDQLGRTGNAPNALVATDVQANNGVIHVIDAVLLPA